MKKTTLFFCIKDEKVLLGMKKRGFGAGKWNGYGGKVQEGESIRAAGIRELKEESGLIAAENDLRQMALIRFYFDKKPLFECSVYVTSTWQGEPVETEEMRPQWYPTSQLPFETMWVADTKWLPLVLSGAQIEADINFNEDGSALREFEYKEARFEK